MSTLRLEIVTPAGKALDVEVSHVDLPGAQGELEILPDHQAALVLLGGGTLRWNGTAGPGLLVVRGGVAEVSAKRVLVLVDEARQPVAADAGIAKSILASVDAVLLGNGFIDEVRRGELRAEQRFAEALLANLSH